MDGVKSMNKYDTMISCNKKTSEEKINRAVTEIRQMLAEEEKVTVPKLVKGQACPEDSSIRMRRSEKKWTGHWNGKWE